MAVVVSAYDLVARVDALAGDVGAFARAVPNATFCTDGALARASFMAFDDRERFAAMVAHVRADAVARVDKHRATVDAPWLERGRHSGEDAVWMRGDARGLLVVPVTWKPGEVIFGTAEEVRAHLEYIGAEGNVEVFRDRRTGQKRYAARTQPVLDRERAERVEAARREGAALLRPLLPKVLRREALGFFERRHLKQAIALFEQVVEALPSDWSARWTLGMAARASGEHRVALEHLRRAYDANPSQRDVGREYAGQCFILGEAADGVRVSRELSARFPDDVGLQSNLALALLIGGDLDEAHATAHAAHLREPSDPITKNLLATIPDVKAGRVARPTRLPGS